MSSKQVLQGEVVSSKMNKTVVVRIVSTQRHAKYHKRFSTARKYKAHSENNEFKPGDIVEIQASKPISREKRWVVTRKVK